MAWLDAGAADAFSQGGSRVDLADRTLALFRIEDDFYVIGDTCSHAMASLSEGELWDYDVECPLHGAEFDVRTGVPRSLPATQPVPTYEVRLEEGRVMVNVDAGGGDR